MKRANGLVFSLKLVLSLESEELIRKRRHALSIEPDDPGLKANLALCLILSGKIGEAKSAAEASLAIDPDGQITINLHEAIAEIESGKRAAPKSIRELEEQ